MPGSKRSLLERDLEHLIHPLHSRRQHERGHVWVRGQGALIVEADGHECIDGLAGLWNVAAGHGRQELAKAASKQMETVAYCSGYAGSSNPRAIELGERLADLIYPSINRFFFTSGGGEASETSFKLARSYWKIRGKDSKTKVISRQWGYHGVTLAAMSATGISAYWPLFEPRVPGFVHIPSPYPYRYEAPPGTNPGVAAADELEAAILREGPDTVAMFIAEPVQGAGGVLVPQDEYFPRIREICDRYQVLLVADEVITGFGRTGEWFALQHWGVEPDIVQFAKAITSGYFPFGGVGVSDEIASAVDECSSPWMHAYTYSAHPVGCAVALENIAILEREELPQRAAKSGERLLLGLHGALSEHPHVGEIRGKGLMCAVEYVEDRDTKAEFARSLQVGERLQTAMYERGLFTRMRGEVLCLAPPLVTTDAQLDSIVQTVADSTKTVLG